MVRKPVNNLTAQIAFIHGRPGAHPTHVALAKSVNAEFFFVDRILRYHDLEDSGKIRRYASWLLNSIFFRNAGKYDLILAEGMHVPPVIMKKLRVLRKDQKIAAVLGDEFLFFLKIKWFPKKVHNLMSYLLLQYDALICMSEFQAELAGQVLEGQKRTPKIIMAHEIISGERPKPDDENDFGRDRHRLLFVAHGPSGWRGYYKGMETLLETFYLVAKKYPDTKLTVVGDWDDEYIRDLRAKTGTQDANIEFVGRQKDLLSIFNNSDLCVHVTNGDAFPIATLEAVRAGLPTIVSELTGTKEVMRKIDEKLVVPMNSVEISDRVGWYFELTSEERRKLSQKGRQVMMEYSEEKGIEEFRQAVDSVLMG